MGIVWKAGAVAAGMLVLAAVGAFLWMLYLIRLVNREEELQAKLLERRRKREERARARADRQQSLRDREEATMQAARSIAEDAESVLGGQAAQPSDRSGTPSGA